MPLSWNEIKDRAVSFSRKWQDESRERAEKDSFWNDFFNVFGISRRRVATFEKAVKKHNNKQGFIDLFWSGTLLIEHKSRGKDLNKALQQAYGYFHGLKEHELPKYVLVCDFERFKLADVENKVEHEFTLSDFVNQVHLFGFIAGYKKRTYKDEDPVNIDAAYRMGKLHDSLKAVGYTDHPLQVYLVRLLFCLFAEDTGIYEKGIFQEYIELHTKEDGSDLAMHLAQMFQVLNTPKGKRLSSLDENLNQFPYVNGNLFAEMLPFAAFNSKMREMLLYACALDWSKISPAIFGSMFQAVMNPKQRRNLGAHYTSEKNIQKLIKPLFLDELYAEFEKAKGNSRKLKALQAKIAKLKFLDPACGCGNFLVITYRELRELEIQILMAMPKRSRQRVLDVSMLILVDVDQFYGIEYDEFPAQIAQLAMWLVDHQMNMKVSELFGQYFVRLPLKKSATIVHGNALRIDWESIVPKKQLNYILGNPPFVGKQYQTKIQKEDLLLTFGKVRGIGNLDYVTAWFYKAAIFMQKTKIESAFVSTNSISQGEQVAILWNQMLNLGVIINFAHRTFKWNNKAKGKAAVHVVIVGFSLIDRPVKYLHEYENAKLEAQELRVKMINPYLVEGKNVLVKSTKRPICDVPPMVNGSMPNDSGHLILSTEEKNDLIKIEPSAEKFIKRLVGAREFIQNKERWCLWLVNATPKELKNMPNVLNKVREVKKFRLESSRATTRKLAAFPTRFGEIRQPECNYIITPVTSSEKREYIPIGRMSKDVIATNLCNIIPSSDIFLLGMITSKMCMTWVKYVCGRLKSDYRFTKDNVYNNYPFPKDPSPRNKAKVEKAAQKVLDTRAKYPNSSLADLYHPLTMPPDLVKAHNQLDKAVDLCYRPQAFANERNRIEFLFALYEQYTAPLINAQPTKKRRR